MDPEIDHYKVLGLSSWEEGIRLTEKEISRAFKQKALELHPDKRPDDPYAKQRFQRLQSSYEILGDTRSREWYDNQLRARMTQQQRQEAWLRARAEEIERECARMRKRVMEEEEARRRAEQESGGPSWMMKEEAQWRAVQESERRRRMDEEVDELLTRLGGLNMRGGRKETM